MYLRLYTASCKTRARSVIRARFTLNAGHDDATFTYIHHENITRWYASSNREASTRQAAIDVAVYIMKATRYAAFYYTKVFFITEYLIDWRTRWVRWISIAESERTGTGIISPAAPQWFITFPNRLRELSRASAILSTVSYAIEQ